MRTSGKPAACPICHGPLHEKWERYDTRTGLIIGEVECESCDERWLYRRVPTPDNDKEHS